MLRDEKQVSEKLGLLGLRPDCKIIFYDRSDLHTSCRALWMMKMFGHPPQLLYILDGGFAAWEKYKGKVEAGEPTLASKSYPVKFQEKYVRSLEQMKKNLHAAGAEALSEQVLDARSAVRFAGGEEPRPNLRRGHMPGSFCFPYHVVLITKVFFYRLKNCASGLKVLRLISIIQPSPFAAQG